MRGRGGRRRGCGGGFAQQNSVVLIIEMECMMCVWLCMVGPLYDKS